MCQGLPGGAPAAALEACSAAGGGIRGDSTAAVGLRRATDGLKAVGSTVTVVSSGDAAAGTSAGDTGSPALTGAAAAALALWTAARSASILSSTSLRQARSDCST
eukprot:COSAG01_NODE_16783_length_1204_cov_9.551131_1_plen_104_part_10